VRIPLVLEIRESLARLHGAARDAEERHGSSCALRSRTAVAKRGRPRRGGDGILSRARDRQGRSPRTGSTSYLTVLTSPSTTRRMEPRPTPVRGESSKKVFVGYLGTFGKGQGLEYVVRAAALLEKQRAGIQFVLAGDGPELLGVKSEIARLGVTSVNLRPPMARDETRAFYNSCDVCLAPLAPIPIFSETIPSKIFEIMACERPLVASVSGEAAAIVERSGGGILAKPGDARELADAILKARAMSREDREAMCKRARQYVSTHYDRVALADEYLEILGMVVERRRTNDNARSSS